MFLECKDMTAVITVIVALVIFHKQMLAYASNIPNAFNGFSKMPTQQSEMKNNSTIYAPSSPSY